MKPTPEQLAPLVEALVRENAGLSKNSLAEAITNALTHGHPALNRRKFQLPPKALLFAVIEIARKKLKHERLVAAQKEPLETRIAEHPLSSENLKRL